jgi:transcriptional regulator with XRE-family HTH domain
MAEPDFEQLLTVLGRAIDAVPMTRRDLEDRIGLGHGTLYRLLNGHLELKVRHLLALARVLEVPPGEFLALGCPKATARAQYQLADRLTPPRHPTRTEKAFEGSAPPAAGGIEELRPLLRQLIQEELAAASAGKKRSAS